MEVSGKLAEAEQDLYFCEHCQFENVTSEANGMCRECGEYLCDGCFRHHLKSKRYRGHKLIDIKDSDVAAMKRADVEKCIQHDNGEIKFYCRKHETVGCGNCFIFGHRECKPEYIKDLSKKYQETEDFINLKRKIKHLETKNKSNIENIRKNRKECKTMHEEALAQIRKFRTDINNYLDETESAIISKIKQLMSDNDKRIDKLDIDCANFMSDIETLKQTLDRTVQRENVLFIHTVHSKARILEIEHALSETEKSVFEVKRYDFVPNQHLASIIKSRAEFGELNMSNINQSKPEGPQQLEENVEMPSLVEPKKPAPPETDVGPPSVVVGSRVKGHPIPDWPWHLGQPGTVIAVESCGIVTVKWDATGGRVSGYRVRTGWKGIYPI